MASEFLMLVNDTTFYTLFQNSSSENQTWLFNDTNTNTSDFNNSTSGNDVIHQEDADLLFMILMSVFLGLVILATIVGNIFVIAAIFLERNLQTVGNYLVLSLAVADLMVACLVMPLGALSEVSQEWSLGPELCDVWTSFDVLCCTASILHLLAIAIDRYWAVTNVDYVRQRSARQIHMMIFLVWAVGFLVSIAPIFGWKDPDFTYRIEVEKRCMVSQDAAYQIFATCSTFYVPLILILILYWRIFQVARKRIRHKPGSKAAVKPKRGLKKSCAVATAELTLLPPPKSPYNCRSAENSFATTTTTTTITNINTTNGVTELTSDNSVQHMLPKKVKKPKETMEAKRERKAAKTLAIITGVFVICWLPFFVTALVMPLCSCEPENYVLSLFLWLGYANSLLNPIIYTIFSPDFRSAFKRVLCGAKGVARVHR